MWAGPWQNPQIGDKRGVDGDLKQRVSVGVAQASSEGRLGIPWCDNKINDVAVLL